MQRFRRAVEARDVEAMVSSLAEDVVFSSPIVFHEYRGREVVGGLLRKVAGVLQDLRYVDELSSERQTALEFRARVGDREVQGIDLGETNAEGLVTRLVVFVRPLSGAMALAAAMKAALEDG